MIIKRLNIDKSQVEKELRTKFLLPNITDKLSHWYNQFDQFVEIKMPVENLFIYPEQNIYSALEGYRFILNNNGWFDMADNNDWNISWIILATCNDNPIIADISYSNIQIKYDYVGGKFEPKLLLSNIDKLEFFINEWMCFLSKKGDSVHIQEYINIHLDSFVNLLKKKILISEINNIFYFFGIEKKDIKYKPESSPIYKYHILLCDLGQDKIKVLSEIRKYLNIDLSQTIALTKSLPVELFSGYGDNLIEMAKNLENIGAKIVVKKIE